jgi:hypothetical protein
MTREELQLLGGFDLPDFDSFLCRSCKPVPVGAEIDGSGSGKCGYAPFQVGTPDGYAVVRRAGDIAAIRTERNSPHGAGKMP